MKRIRSYPQICWGEGGGWGICGRLLEGEPPGREGAVPGAGEQPPPKSQRPPRGGAHPQGGPASEAAPTPKAAPPPR